MVRVTSESEAPVVAAIKRLKNEPRHEKNTPAQLRALLRHYVTELPPVPYMSDAKALGEAVPNVRLVVALLLALGVEI